ncbi:MAG TPA: PIN domain-containing protein [Planctomycetota bacterium]|nr:PIN domain-containing protein [Planctomycetota bacterium]
MIAYVDSSVLLRMALMQPNRLAEYEAIESAVASALVEVECLRTLDRLRIAHRVDDEEVARRRAFVYASLERMDTIEVARAVLARAAQPLPTSLATLDAIHLASALEWQDRSGTRLVLATHDAALAMAARACGMRVLGA